MSSELWPFAVLLLSVALIIVLITVLRVHAFLALILAAITAGLLARPGSLPPGRSHWLQAVELTTAEFGFTAGKIGVVIALAAIISMCLMESGAADKVVRRFLAAFGEKRAGAAILISGYILSIPIFFDTFFMLLLPLARAMGLRTGKDYLLYVMAICCGGTVTHSLVAPHPGPLAMAETLKLDLGLTIIVGVVAGIIPTMCSWMTVKVIGRRMQIPVRETGGASLAEVRLLAQKPEKDLPSFAWSILPVILPIFLISQASILIALQGKSFALPDVRNPAALTSLLQADTPLAAHLRTRMSEAGRTALAATAATNVIGTAAGNALVAELNSIARTPNLYMADRFSSVTLRPATAAFLARDGLASENLFRAHRMLLEDTFATELKPTTGLHPTLFAWGEFVGNRNIALLVGAIIAIYVLMRQRGLTLAKVGQMIGPSFETAGVIILITSAGGAFGLMLKNAGVGEAIKAAVVGKEISLVLLSWAVAAMIRIAQGSATVAMLTTAAMIYPIMSTGTPLPYHPIWIFMSIGFGAMMLSWMNDSGFWVVGKLSGLTEKETLKSWTVVLSVNSAAGLVVCLIGSKLLPMI